MKTEYKAGDVVDVIAAIKIPVSATAEQVEAWLKFQLGFTGGLDCSNPLTDCDVESVYVRI